MVSVLGPSPASRDPRLDPTDAPLATAWQPLTPRGVAAFAFARWRRLAGVQCLFAGLSVGVILWLLHQAFLPTLGQAVDRLPDEGRVNDTILTTPLTSYTVLAKDPILAVAINLPGAKTERLTSDFQLTFQVREVELCTPLGCLGMRYPASWIIEFNRRELKPALDAWSPIVFAILGLALVPCVLLLWAFLASLLLFMPIAVARYADRYLPLGASWKLASAALMPGTVLMGLGVVGYGLGYLTWNLLIGVGLAYLMLTWLYLLLAPQTLPRKPVLATLSNPFVPPPEAEPLTREPAPSPPGSPNPFANPASEAAPDRARSASQAED